MKLHHSRTEQQMEVSGQLHAPVRFIPEDTVPGTYWIWGWVGPRANEDTVEKRKILYSRELNPGHPACSPLLYQLLFTRVRKEHF
jgi:hypothetical protein